MCVVVFSRKPFTQLYRLVYVGALSVFNKHCLYHADEPVYYVYGCVCVFACNVMLCLFILYNVYLLMFAMR